MKLYSGRQLLLVGIGGALLGSALALGISLSFFPAFSRTANPGSLPFPRRAPLGALARAP